MRFENLKNLYYFIIINVSFTLQASYWIYQIFINKYIHSTWTEKKLKLDNKIYWNNIQQNLNSYNYEKKWLYYINIKFYFL